MTHATLSPDTVVATDSRVNILLVDDQPGKLLTYEAMLGSLGENLLVANSGREALELLLKTEITVILMDVSMPDLDGFELAEMIRAHPRYDKTAIIFVSAVHLTDLDRLKGYHSGAVDYVSVPVIPDLLRAKVRVFIDLYRKTREAEQLTRELERRVQERTAELEASMQRQSALAEQLLYADRRKDEFLALLAHELRNPLAPVQNVVNIMQMKEIDDPEMRWCCNVLERQLRQLTRLVDDLMDVSRITHGKITLQREPVRLDEIIQNALEACRPLIDSHKHTVNVTMPEGVVQLTGDAARLTQVISNLLNNAAKYQRPNGVIDIILESVAGYACVTIRDRGIGMPPELLHDVFDLFAQGERTVDRSQGGLGVGLSLVKTLVEMHGGSVEARSDGIGKGSEFVVRLPLEGTTVRAISPMPDVRVAGKARNILIVDDNRDSAESMASLLQLHGHQVQVCFDGYTALEQVAVSAPSVMLLDLGLPGIDGYDVCRKIREQGLSNMQVIAMTGFGQERDQQRSHAAGFNSHTVKPLNIDALLTLLDALPEPGALRTSSHRCAAE